MKIRTLEPNEVECRVSQCGKSQYGAWCTLLLYKDARVDMRILDEVYGPNNWQREHTMIGDRLYCTISIWDDEKKAWIKKQDVGTESNAEPEKGQASDAFKRAGFNVGIGRELYTAPYIRFNLNDDEYDVIGKDKYGKDKITTNAKFDVVDIQHNEDGSIKSVTIVDKNGVVRFPKQGGASKPKAKSAPAPQTQTQQTSAPAPAPAKLTMSPAHENWYNILQSIVDGLATLEQYKKKYHFSEYDEQLAKDWILNHQK